VARPYGRRAACGWLRPIQAGSIQQAGAGHHASSIQPAGGGAAASSEQASAARHDAKIPATTVPESHYYYREVLRVDRPLLMIV
jgi:hypothetical protein